MTDFLTDETIEYVSILAKLELSPEEKATAKKDMQKMLDYIDRMNELDTEGVKPLSHAFPMQNVFREDVITNGNGSAEVLQNAPARKGNLFMVPKTFE